MDTDIGEGRTIVVSLLENLPNKYSKFEPPPKLVPKKSSLDRNKIWVYFIMPNCSITKDFDRADWVVDFIGKVLDRALNKVS